MIHPDTELRWIDQKIGYGVVATRLIPRGTVTWVLDDLDRRLTSSEIAQLPPMLGPLLTRYGYLDAEGRWTNKSDPPVFAGGAGRIAG